MSTHPAVSVTRPGHRHLAQPPNLIRYFMPLVLESQVFSHNLKLNARQNTNMERAVRAGGWRLRDRNAAGACFLSSWPLVLFQQTLQEGEPGSFQRRQGTGPTFTQTSFLQTSVGGVCGAHRVPRAGGRGAFGGLSGHRLSQAELLQHRRPSPRLCQWA